MKNSKWKLRVRAWCNWGHDSSCRPLTGNEELKPRVHMCAPVGLIREHHHQAAEKGAT